MNKRAGAATSGESSKNKGMKAQFEGGSAYNTKDDQNRIKNYGLMPSLD